MLFYTFSQNIVIFLLKKVSISINFDGMVIKNMFVMFKGRFLCSDFPRLTVITFYTILNLHLLIL